MYVSPRPTRPPQNDPALPRSVGPLPVLACALSTLLMMMTGAILLARHVAAYTGTVTRYGGILADCGLP